MEILVLIIVISLGTTIYHFSDGEDDVFGC